MTPPKHPEDERLKAYVRGDSWPPDAEDQFQKRRRRALALANGDSDVFNIEELVRSSEQRAAAYERDKLEAEKARADKAEARLGAIVKWVAGIVAGVLVVVFAAWILGKKG